MHAPTQADFAAIVSVSEQSRRQAMPWLPQLHTVEETVAYFRSLWPAHTFWLARDADGQLLGFIVFDADWIHHLYLHPMAQRKGLGSALLGRALADGKPRQLWCFTANTPARAFYLRQGFTVVKETDGADNEERCPDVLFHHPGRH